MKTLLARMWKALRLPKGVQLLVMRFSQDQFLVGVTGIILNEKKVNYLLFVGTMFYNDNRTDCHYIPEMFFYNLFT